MASDVEGVPMSFYGRGTAIAWEGTFEKDIHLGRGDTSTLRVARFYPSLVMLRFVISPSPDNPVNYGEGLPLDISSGRVEFDLAVRDAERDQVASRRMKLQFDDGGALVASLHAAGS